MVSKTLTKNRLKVKRSSTDEILAKTRQNKKGLKCNYTFQYRFKILVKMNTAVSWLMKDFDLSFKKKM